MTAAVTKATPDQRVPVYLGRLLDPGGEYAGTCFQIAPGYVATAWHVLDDLGAGDAGATVALDSLRQPGKPWEATVHAVDELGDLAVLETSRDLGAPPPGFAPTDQVSIGTEIVVTGAADIADPGHEYQFLDAPGKWAGGTTRDDSIPLGRARCQDLVPGMSGAPVRRLADNVVVGVVSGRYNSADGWLAGSVWVARVEQLAVLFDGLAEIQAKTAAARAPVEMTLRIGEGVSRLVGDDVDVSASHSGVPVALSRTVNEAWHARVRSKARAADSDSGEQLDRAGALLAESFLPASLATALAGELERAERGHQSLHLGVECDPELSNLPWETLPDPRDGNPLVLHPLTNVYRVIAGVAPQLMPSPLRILVAISSPDRDGGPPLDYENELRNVLAAVRAARQSEARVRIVRFATTAAIKQALEVDRAHVLHISGHGGPGKLVIEDEEGRARQVDADTFVEEAIPPGAMPPVFALSACYTNVADAAGAPSFAARLIGRGASAVIASETSLTDVYATRVFARIYGCLADAGTPDAVGAACDARRMVQGELSSASDERDRQLGELNEWAALSVIATSGSILFLDPDTTVPPPPSPPRSAIGPVAARAIGDFVGRRREQRTWPVELLAQTHAGMVLHGIGGVGKTSLAAELITAALEREPGRGKLVLFGQITAETLLSSVAAAVRQRALTTDRMQPQVIQAISAAEHPDLSPADRLALLRENLLDSFPLLIVLDNFEDNLEGDGTEFCVGDAALAELLSSWMADPAASRFLITSRHPFSLPASRQTRLLFRPLGPLSAAETGKLVWSLPALDRLSRDEVERVWRLLGGHPRSLEYLDALLSQGIGRYPDITERLSRSLVKTLGNAEAAAVMSAENTLDEALAATVSIAADDVILPRLIARLRKTEGARELLIGASTFRRPVEMDGILFQVGRPNRPDKRDEDIATRRTQASMRAQMILEDAGVESPAQLDLARMPDSMQADLAKQMKELEELPEIPREAPAELDAMITACIASGLLSRVEETDDTPRYFVHRWTASELERIERERGQKAEIDTAQARAGDYWAWRAYCAVEIRPHIDDLLEARHHYLKAGLVARAVEVSDEAGRYLTKIGALDEKLRLTQETLELIDAGSLEEALWTFELASTLLQLSNRMEAEKLFRKALGLMEHHEDLGGVAACSFSLGTIALQEGELDEAERLLRRTLEIEEARESAQLHLVLEQLGQLAWRRGEIIESRELRERAAKIRGGLDDRSSLAASYVSDAEEAMRRDDLDEAEAALLQALELAEVDEDADGIAATVSGLGDIALQREDFEEAERHYARALEIYKDMSRQSGIGFISIQLADLSRLRGEPEEAEALLQHSLSIMEAIDDPRGIARALRGLGAVSYEREDFERAISLHGRAFITLQNRRYIQVAIGEIHQLEAIQEIVGYEALCETLLATFDEAQAKEIIRFLRADPPGQA
jgi:tetratricopeptide (TPR) repeat protein